MTSSRSSRASRSLSFSEPPPPPALPVLNMNRTLFLLVFLSGAVVALSTLLLSDYFRALRVQEQERLNLFPDQAHISLIDESGIFYQRPTTELTRPKSSEVMEEEGGEQSFVDCEAESLIAMQAAVTSKEKKQNSRALKLFKHAIALCPKHPKVLNFYGEFLEDTELNLREADHLYVRAIAFAQVDSEDYQRALDNRRRTAALVEKTDLVDLNRIEEKKAKFQHISSKSAGLKRAKKEAYFQHIYHSVGIEGSTMTLAQTRSILETKLAVAGKSILEHNEVLGLDAALKYINNTLVDKVGEITMDDILQIHKRVIGYVDPIEAGMMRRTQVYVGDYVPPHPGHIELLMQRFVLWLNSPDNVALHPIRFAALAHYKLVYIHPFVDGNGRTSRLLMNLILMQSGYPPVIIRKQDRLQYYQALVTANEGDIRPFVRFIGECTERTLDAYISATLDVVTSRGGLVLFDDMEETTIPAQDHMDYHEKIILGGYVGDNITVEP